MLTTCLDIQRFGTVLVLFNFKVFPLIGWKPRRQRENVTFVSVACCPIVSTCKMCHAYNKQHWHKQWTASGKAKPHLRWVIVYFPDQFSGLSLTSDWSAYILHRSSPIQHKPPSLISWKTGRSDESIQEGERKTLPPMMHFSLRETIWTTETVQKFLRRRQTKKKRKKKRGTTT